MGDNFGAVLHGKEDLRVEKLQPQELADNDILVAMHHVGICGTDIHFYMDGLITGLGTIDETSAQVIGHEGGGRIVEVGSKVKNLKVGDRVILDPNGYCRFCDYCLNGRDNLCTNPALYYLNPKHGFFEKYHVHSASYAYKIPDALDFKTAALTEPLTCSLHAIKRANVQYGSKVLICGAGPIGLLHVIMAKLYGATFVAISDVDSDRLSTGPEVGADKTILIDPARTPESVGKELYEETEGGVDITFDCSGVEYGLRMGIEATKEGGKLAMTGLHGKEATLPVNIVTCKEMDILGIIRYRSACFREAIDLISNKKVDVTPLITHEYPLKDIQTAISSIMSRSSKVVKVLINCAE